MKQQALMAALALGATAAPINGQAQVATPHPTIVLVHGGFVDGSGWEGVFKGLRKKGYTVTIVQNPTTSLSDDVAATRRAIASSSGPVILVGHSYGGVVITEAGNDRGARLHRGLRRRQGRVGCKVDPESATGGTRASDSPAPGRVLVPR